MSQVELDPRKQPLQERARATVEAILDATAQVLVQEGYERASTNRIAKRAGVSVGSLYQYFPNKQALVLAVAQRHSYRKLERLQRHIVEMAGAPVKQAVRQYVHLMLEAHQVDPALDVALLPHIIGLGLEQFLAFQQQVLMVVRAWMEQHKRELMVTDLDTATFVLVSAAESVVHGSLLQTGVDPAALEKELGDLILRYLFTEV